MVQKANKDSSMGRKERESASRREAILDAAQEMFESIGYVNTTMAQIAGRSEFGVGTIYQFFSSKQDLFVEVINRSLQYYISGLEQVLEEKKPLEDGLRAYMQYNLSWIEEHPEFHRLIYEVFYSPIPDITSRVLDQFKEIHRRNIDFIRDIFSHAEEANQSLDPEIMSLMLLGIVHAISDNWFMGILNKRPTEYIDTIQKLILGEVKRD